MLCDPVGAGWSVNLLGRPMPRHEFVDAGLRPPVDKARQHVGEIGLRIDQIQLAGLDEQRHASPSGAD